MIDKFEELLKELSIQLEIQLHLDKNGACTIFFDEKIKVQLELDKNLENLIVFCSINSITPGKFRENVLLEALKENDKFPYIATFAFFERESSLAMFNFLNFSSLSAQMLSSYLTLFVDLAILYQDALSHGQTSPILKPV
jgi:hypothetical protein